MADQRNEAITANHVRLVMESLGKFHAISFALKDQHLDKFEELSSSLKVPVISREDESQRKLLKKQSLYLFDAMSGEEDAHLAAALKKLFTKEPADIALDCLNLKLIGPATVISHGDAWQNNFMFRHDYNGKPTEVSFLDWQLSFCSTPIIDLTFFLLCSTTKDVRDTHYDEFIDLYYEHLSSHIQR